MSFKTPPKLSPEVERLAHLLETYTERVRGLSVRRRRYTFLLFGIILTGLAIALIIGGGAFYLGLEFPETFLIVLSNINIVEFVLLILLTTMSISMALLLLESSYRGVKSFLRRRNYRVQGDDLVLASGRLLAVTRVASQHLDHSDLHVIDQMTLGLLLNDAQETYLESLDYVSEEKVKKEARLARPKNWDAREEKRDLTEEAQEEAPVG